MKHQLAKVRIEFGNLRGSINRVGLCLGQLASAFIATQSLAATGFVKGQVEFVRTHDAAFSPGWSPPKFWFSLKGVTQAGTCPKWVNGSVLIVSDDKQTLALVLMAQGSGSEVAVGFDDAYLVNGLCHAAQYVTIGNPAPAY